MYLITNEELLEIEESFTKLTELTKEEEMLYNLIQTINNLLLVNADLTYFEQASKQDLDTIIKEGAYANLLEYLNNNIDKMLNKDNYYYQLMRKILIYFDIKNKRTITKENKEVTLIENKYIDELNELKHYIKKREFAKALKYYEEHELNNLIELPVLYFVDNITNSSAHKL